MATDSPTSQVAQVQGTQFIPTLDNIDIRNIQRIYQPLDGEEVIKAILAHIEKKLRLDNNLTQHMIYEQVMWRFNLQVEWLGYANSKLHTKTDGGLKVDRETTDKASVEFLPGGTTIKGDQLNSELAPDDIREKTNQPIPVATTKGQGSGNIVRVPPGKLQGRK